MWQLTAGLGIATVIAGLLAYTFYLEKENALQDYEAVVQVNQQNQRVIRELSLDKQIEHARRHYRARPNATAPRVPPPS